MIMALPQPKVALIDACSVIFNNTLYSYSTGAFQSLSLTRGASWTELTQGEKVTGGVCVGSTPADSSRAALFVVGGLGETPAYQGLQKFTYSTGKWEAVPAAGAATQNRTGHGAVYINSTDTILVYAGALGSSASLSTQTFSISASSGDVLAHTSTAPPAHLPILLTWSASQAALVGGSNTNNKVMLFSIAQGWIDSGTTLAEPLQKSSAAIKATIMDGDDGSKSLYTFDPTVSPTVVNRTVLMNSLGRAIPESAPITKRLVVEEAGLPWTARRQADQALTLGSWPAYNSTFGPSSVLDSYSLAENGDGMVVLAGDGDSFLSIFSARENCWEDASAVLGRSKNSSTSTDGGQTSSSATSTVAAAAATSSGSATAAAAASKSNTKVLLWSILGSVVGAAALLGIVLLLVKRRTRKRAHLEAGHSRRASGPSSVGEKGGFAFAKDSLPQPLASPTSLRGHQHQESTSSFSSVAVLTGRFNQQRTGTSGGLSGIPSDPPRQTSADSMSSRAFKNTISNPIPHLGGAAASTTNTPPPLYEEIETAMVDEKGGPAVVVNKINLAPAPAPRARNNKPDRSPDTQDGSTRRSSGWNRYWSGGPALNILGFGSDKQQNDAAVASRDVCNGRQDAVDQAQRSTQRSTIVSVGSSHYNDVPPLRPAQDSGNLMPLQVYQARALVSRVNSANPAISHLAPQSQHSGLSGQIEMSRLSGASMLSTISGGDKLGYPSGLIEAYDDLRDHTAGPDGFAMPWSGSGQTAGRVPSSAYSQSVYSTGGARPSCPIAQLPLASDPALFSQQQQSQERPPTGVSRQPALARAEISDMSWLNLREGSC